MTQISQTVYLYAVSHSWDKEWRLNSTTSPTMADASDEHSQWVLLEERVLTAELPAAEDLLAEQIAGLNSAKQKVRAEAQSTITKIEETIQSLLALPDNSHVIE